MSNIVKVATWNINSVRLRIDQVIAFLNEQQPEVLGLQEIKCVEEQFPYEPFREAGYAFIEVKGQKGYHGAATCLLYTSPSPRDQRGSRMPSSA